MKDFMNTVKNIFLGVLLVVSIVLLVLVVFSNDFQNDVEVSVEQYENVIEWNEDFPGLDSLVQSSVKDGTLTQNEMYYIEKKYNELRMAKAKKDIVNGN